MPDNPVWLFYTTALAITIPPGAYLAAILFLDEQFVVGALIAGFVCGGARELYRLLFSNDEPERQHPGPKHLD